LEAADQRLYCYLFSCRGGSSINPWLVSRCEPSLQKPALGLRPVRLLSLCSGCPVFASHTSTVLSSEADARRCSAAEKATRVTVLVWPLRVCSDRPVFVAHTCTVLSYEADASRSAAAEKATLMTLSLWPLTADSSNSRAQSYQSRDRNPLMELSWVVLEAHI
jgi:hypothetical protein